MIQSSPEWWSLARKTVRTEGATRLVPPFDTRARPFLSCCGNAQQQGNEEISCPDWFPWLRASRGSGYVRSTARPVNVSRPEPPQLGASNLERWSAADVVLSEEAVRSAPRSARMWHVST